MIGVGLKNWPAHLYQNYPQFTNRPTVIFCKVEKKILKLFLYFIRRL